jgi:outer membrane receptor for ferrienterochelin and colicins
MRQLSLTLVLSLLILPFAIAQDEEKVTVEDYFKLVQEGKVITSTKTERLLKTVPHAVTVITRKQIEESGATTLSDILRVVPGLNARLTPMGGQIGIRSFGTTPFSERVLFLIDGTPYNSPDKGGYPGHPAYEDFFPIEAIKRVEVIKGPGSALYGQNAFFGIINIITDEFKSTTDVRATGGSRSTGGVVGRGGVTKEDWTFTYLGKYKQQDGPMRFLSDPSETPNLPNLNNILLDGTDVKSGDLYVKARRSDIALSYLFHRDTTDSYSYFKPRNFNNPDIAAPPFSEVAGCCATQPTEQTLQFLDAAYEHKMSESRNLRLKAFYNRRNGNTCGNCHNLIPGIQDQDETNQRFFFNGQLDWVFAAHKVIFGGDLQFDKTDKEVAKIDQLGDTSDPSINTVAGYVQDEITLLDGKGIATLGVRVDQNEKTDTAVSPSVSFVYLPTEKLVVRTLYGRAFRQPTWNDLFTVTRYFPVSPGVTRDANGNLVIRNTVFQRGNPDVDTERIDTIEGGVEYFFDPSISVKLDAFWSRASDLIEAYDFQPAPLDPACTTAPCIVAKTKNLDNLDLDSKGFEIEARVKPSPMVSALLGYSYQKNDFDRLAPTTFLSAYSPEHKITALVDFQPIDPLLLNLSLNYWSKYDTRTFLAETPTCGACVNTDQIGQPFTMANFKALYRIPLGSRQVGLGFVVKNIFDEELQISHAFRVDAALTGREYFGTVEFSF